MSRTVFIYILGSTYLGVNGLYSEILSLLSFAELGFGSAMTFAMYKPVANNDVEHVVKLLDFYKTVYRIVAGVIAVIGLCMVPFLPHIVRGAEWLTIKELRIYFLIFLFNTVVGYFVSYKYSYLNALQKNYIITNINAIVTTATHILQILIIIIYKNFLLFLLTNSIVLTGSRILIAIYLNRKYPLLSQKPEEPLSKEEKRPIYREVQGLVVHQFSNVAVHSTDNILISMVSGLGVTAVGYVSNYYLLMNSVLGFVTIVFDSVVSGFGNLAASSTADNYRKVFKELNFINFWIYGFCTISFWILVPPFITMWIGDDKLIDTFSFTLIIINCYLQGQSAAYNTARIAKGNFLKDKNWALAQAVVNLVVSIIAAKYLGLVGIYIGTVVSRLVYVLFRPYSTYKFLFEESSKEYYTMFVSYFLRVVIAAVATYFATQTLLKNVTVLHFIEATFIVAIVPNLVFMISTYKKQEFRSCMMRAKKLVVK